MQQHDQRRHYASGSHHPLIYRNFLFSGMHPSKHFIDDPIARRTQLAIIFTKHESALHRLNAIAAESLIQLINGCGLQISNHCLATYALELADHATSPSYIPRLAMSLALAVADLVFAQVLLDDNA
jgi:hypothetical protein